MPILDVAIGIVFFYVTLSLICSAIADRWAILKKKRESLFEEGIRMLLQSDEAPAADREAADTDDQGREFWRKIYKHPLVSPAGESRRPTRVDSVKFARALLDVVRGDQELAGMDSAKKAIENIPVKEVRQALESLMLGAKQEYDEWQTRIASWFDDAMGEVSKMYKAVLGKMVAGFSIILVLVLNADTVVLMERLWADESLRESLVATADQFEAQGEPQGAPTTPDTSWGQAIAEELKQIQEQTRPFPIGWPAFDQFYSDPRGLHVGQPQANGEYELSFLTLLTAVVRKLVGLAMTVIAVSLGAPFWFDLLRMILSLRRGGGTQQAKAPTAATTATESGAAKSGA